MFVVALTDRAAVRRLLDRFGFGPGPGDVDAGVTRGFAATAAALLNPGPDAGVAATPEPDLGPEPAPVAKGDTVLVATPILIGIKPNGDVSLNVGLVEADLSGGYPLAQIGRAHV